MAIPREEGPMAATIMEAREFVRLTDTELLDTYYR
jgi:hypothetical protein